MYKYQSPRLWNARSLLRRLKNNGTWFPHRIFKFQRISIKHRLLAQRVEIELQKRRVKTQNYESSIRCAYVTQIDRIFPFSYFFTRRAVTCERNFRQENCRKENSRKWNIHPIHVRTVCIHVILQQKYSFL